MMWLPVHALNLNILRVKARADLLLKLEIAKKLLGLIVMCSFLPLGLEYFCAANIGSAIISVYINSWYTGKMYDFGFGKQIKGLFPVWTLSITMFAIVFFVNGFIQNLWAQTIIGSVLGISIYLAGAYVFHYTELQDIKYFLHRGNK